jgi:precorrin-6A/cobalt-precorrin-6A reductase
LRVLILGGIGEANRLAVRASTIPDIEVILSLAGRTSPSIQTQINTRIGGFGGIAGLVDYLQDNSIDLLVDATHPFASQISFNAATASQVCKIPRLMLIRPAWQPIQGDRWIEVENLQAAAQLLPSLAKRVFLTIGKQELSAFAHLSAIWFLMRSIERPTMDISIPKGKFLLVNRTFLVADERDLLQTYQIQAIVSKNSGGEATYAKIIAARELGIPVVMIQRPMMPSGDLVSEVESAYQWIIDIVKY